MAGSGSAADTTRAPRRLLAVVAHPDDEAFALGGTLARHARDGVDVKVVCATRGEHGCTLAEHAALSTSGCGELRTAELAASCRVLGVAPPVLLDLPDGGLAAIDPYPVVAQFRELLTEHRPQVVLTMGSDGAYGHTDHIALTRVVRQAVAPLDHRPRLLHTAFPRRLFEPVWRALRRLPGVIDPTVRAEMLGTTRGRVDLVVDVRPMREQKLAAIACHRSQLPGGDPLTFLIPGLVEDLLDEEWFTVVDGPVLPPATSDPFAGLEVLT